MGGLDESAKACSSTIAFNGSSFVKFSNQKRKRQVLSSLHVSFGRVLSQNGVVATKPQEHVCHIPWFQESPLML